MLSPAAQTMACGLRRPLLRQPNTPFYFLPSAVSPLSANLFFAGFFSMKRPYLHSSPNLRARFPRCLAATPPPPDSTPSSDPDLVRSSGLDVKFMRLKDTVQIFFAVLFWMSLFFWACVWDDKNSGNPTKGSRFRR
uniref:Uncharacterized protein n=1 Tax=Kalanchoe fedtschenkoi TaxID=63787 RepID=A0A7N0ZU22_KALFE